MLNKLKLATDISYLSEESFEFQITKPEYAKLSCSLDILLMFFGWENRFNSSSKWFVPVIVGYRVITFQKI